jgi:predicted RNA-binding Zn-ribbon protein involved in translation (DUF1610 family)
MVEIAGAISAFKAAKDLGKVIFDAKIDAAVKEKAREVIDKLGDAQDTLYQLRDELLNVQTDNADLKRQIAEADEWTGTAAHYEMVKTSGGAIVYKFKGSPEHYACPNCMGAKRITPLQDNRTSSGKYRCTSPSCNGAEFPVDPQKPLPSLNYPHGGGERGWMGS